MRSHINENGVAAVTFGADVPWIDERPGRILAEVLGSGSVLMYRGGMGTTFVAGIVRPDPKDTRLAAWQPDPTIVDLPITTDDWPYLYLRKAAIPPAYWQMLVVIGVVCLALIARSFPQAMRPNWHFWLLGAGFLLIEFKSVTELALLFGTTWLVNALAISGVLLMAVVANLLVLHLRRVNLRRVYALLLGSLILSYFFPLELLIGLPPSIRGITSMVLLSFPIFSAGVIFSESLRRAGETAGPLASNLSGSFAGGVLEYGSLLWGIKSLYLIAAVVYAGALIAQQMERD